MTALKLVCYMKCITTEKLEEYFAYHSTSLQPIFAARDSQVAWIEEILKELNNAQKFLQNECEAQQEDQTTINSIQFLCERNIYLIKQIRHRLV
jgi:hypothetical protein